MTEREKRLIEAGRAMIAQRDRLIEGALRRIKELVEERRAQ